MIEMMPNEYPNVPCRFCKDGSLLKPHIESFSGTKNDTTYHIDYWYCLSCGLMYHYEQLESIIEED
ncbi:MAG: hypothetical protein IMZ52_01065 [Actinobacteria bacterium]|nr:hypothetical protein [Actinomycetota bacterium]MBE3114728.1 hypothetical protein [Actinomycetota bacterium]